MTLPSHLPALKLKILLIVLLILVTGFTRFWQLDNPDPSADELSYIDDGYLYSVKDPRINPRHHMFRHPPPNFPHPFLVSNLIASNFKLFGYSIYIARLPIAVFSLFLVFAVFILGYLLSKNFNLALTAAFFSAILPLNIRYARESYLDAALAFFVVITCLFWYLFLSRKKVLFGLIAGITLALALSTKITGLALLPALIVSVIWYFRKNINFYFKLWPFILSFIFVFLLLNSPSAYLDGLTYHPNTGVEGWGVKKIFEGLLSPKYFDFWAYMIIYNFTLPVSILTLVGFYLLKIHPKNKENKAWTYLLIFCFVYFVFAVTTHLPTTISGPWAFQPEANLFLLIGTFALFNVHKYKLSIFLFSLIFILPFSIVHGFRLDYDPFLKYHNVKFGEENISKITAEINSLANKKNEFYIHQSYVSSAVPEWLLAENVNFKPWTHQRPLDAIITDNPTPDIEKQYNIYKQYTYGRQPTIYIYLRKP